MQTFDVRPPAFRSAPRNDQIHSNSENPARADDNFGALMDRALTGNSRESSSDNSDVRSENSGPQGPNSSSTNRSKQTDKSKKPLRSELEKDNLASSTQAVEANPNSPHLLKAAEAQRTPEDEGTSHDAPESDADKGKSAATTAKNSSDTSKSITAPVLMQTPTPAGSPSSTPVPAEGSKSKDAKGSLSRVSDADGQAEQPDATTHSDSKSVDAKDTADPGDKISTASDPPAKDAPESKPPSDKAVAATVLAPTSEAAGTSAAKQYMTMKKTDKTPKIAGPAEQDLPGDATTGSEELPMVQKSSAATLLHGSEKLDSSITVDSSAAARISPEPTAAAATQAVAPAAEVDDRLRVLERTHDIVALHAMRLTQSGSDSLHVVVKPGGGIQLSLELRQGEGFIEVSASLHKGDFAHLSQYWPELQQRLEARGVRVSDLACSENLSDAGHQEFQQPKQQQQSPDQDPLHAGAFAEFALAGSLREAPATRAARATAYRGWETWA